MKLKLFQIDTFTNTLFQGNPACVVPLEVWTKDIILKKIAKENAVSETAFFIKSKDGFHLRWFTPEIEMDLCGHATIAATHVLKKFLRFLPNKIKFYTQSGKLTVTVRDDLYTLDLPARKPVAAILPAIIKSALSIQPKEVLLSRDYVLVYNSQQQVKDIKINRQKIDEINLDPGGIIITSEGQECDFVSRFFTPQASIFEDPVTGSAHCSLIPYWSRKLGKENMTAVQLSERAGILFCRNKSKRVLISGHAKTYSAGYLWTE